MDKAAVFDLMLSSMNAEEWNANCDKVKHACGGDYPDFWFAEIVRSGLMGAVTQGWKR